MDSWANEFLVMIQTIVDEIEQFVADVTKDVEAAVDGLIDASEELIEHMEATIAPDLEQRLNDFLDPILEAYLGFEVSVSEAVQPVVNTVEPLMNEHPACVGCRHYHGQSYNGVMLVCGMHPMGWEDEKCPDWESFWKDSSQ
ncbi:MAG: hypothetical protein NW224_07475 [Leptolyngbyaceae cyanobacterium bins.302]|nr:hypothetical protein [Leptolyngbyaceae cyanobacterium bins.302]